MKTYKAIVIDKASKTKTTVESEYRSKTAFINDLRQNGYAVDPIYVKTKEVFEYIINCTNCYQWDWKEINEIPT